MAMKSPCLKEGMFPRILRRFYDFEGLWLGTAIASHCIALLALAIPDTSSRALSWTSGVLPLPFLVQSYRCSHRCFENQSAS